MKKQKRTRHKNTKIHKALLAQITTNNQITPTIVLRQSSQDLVNIIDCCAVLVLKLGRPVLSNICVTLSLLLYPQKTI